MAEVTVDYRGGTLAVIDHGGDGIPVVFGHSVGVCAANWDVTVSYLGPGLHAYAVDLPGHGRTTVEPESAEDAWEPYVAVTRALGLDRPLLVVHDPSAGYGCVALRRYPDLFRGFIGVGGPLYFDREQAIEDVAFIQDPGMADLLRERFHLGESGNDEASAREYIDSSVARAGQDWLLDELQAGLRREVERYVARRPDGGWEHRPRIEAIQRLISLPPDDADIPGPHFYDPITVPVWTVVLRECYTTPRAEHLDAARALPHLRLAYLDSGPWPQYETPAELAALVEKVAADPWRTDLLPPPPEHERAYSH